MLHLIAQALFRPGSTVFGIMRSHNRQNGLPDLVHSNVNCEQQTLALSVQANLTIKLVNAVSGRKSPVQIA